MKNTVTAAAKAHQSKIPHHVLKGIKSTEKQVTDNAKARERRITPVKYPHDMVVSPDRKHKTSSGKKGNKNMTDKNKLSLPFNFFCHF